MRTITLFLAVAALLCVALIGCGGSGSNVGSGGVRMTIVWPELPTGEDRFIPRAAQSLTITLANTGGTLDAQTVSRPAVGEDSTVTFPTVPVGEVAITVVAYPNADGTGTPLATATTSATISNRQTTTITLDLFSTITSVTIDQFPTGITATETATLLATAKNANGDVVLVVPQPNGFYWESGNTAVATVDQNGVLTAVSEGIVRITAMERETGVTGYVDLLIKAASGALEIVILNGEIAVGVMPSTVTLAPKSTQQFTAAVTGVPNQAVIWSIVEANGGFISSSGLYTAPVTGGTFHVRATSIADETKFAEATVSVEAIDRRIYFRTTRDGNGNIYSMNADGSDQRPLTTMATDESYPSVSRDGTRIVFTSNMTDVWIINADGSGLTNVTSDAAYDFAPKFSPDGKTIVYFSQNSSGYDIYTIPVTGGARTQLTTAEGNDDSPRFSPDGSKIIFRSNRDGNYDLYIMNADGTNQTRLTNTPNIEAFPCFSPDGSLIAFNRDYLLCVMNSDGTNVRQLSTTMLDIAPSFSPDGTEVVCHTNRYGNYNICRMDIMTGMVTMLTTDTKSTYPAWTN